MKYRIVKQGKKFIIQEWVTFLFWTWWNTWGSEFGDAEFDSVGEAVEHIKYTHNIREQRRAKPSTVVKEIEL
jgi:hypothetical protein